MNKLATENPVIVVPVVVVKPVPVSDPTVIVPVDIEDLVGIVGMAPKLRNTLSKSPLIEYSIELYFIWGYYPSDILHQVYSF